MKFTKKALRELKNMEGFNDRLSKRVINSLLATELSTEDLKNHMNDIVEYGCINGSVGSLIYYSDTTRFFNNYKKEIINLLKESFDTIGNIHENCQGKYIKIYGTIIYKDQRKFTLEEKNNLAWFAYEEIVRRITQEYFGF